MKYKIRENNREHAAALERTGFWGKAGAGCLFLAMDTGRICIAHRSRHVQEPNTWGTWGGAIDSSESPQDAVQREVQEEAGYHGALKLVPLYVFKHPSGFTYYNFLALVKHEFEPEMDWETQGFRWVFPEKLPTPAHPGLKTLFNDKTSVDKIVGLSNRVRNGNIQ